MDMRRVAMPVRPLLQGVRVTRRSPDGVAVWRAFPRVGGDRPLVRSQFTPPMLGGVETRIGG